MQAKRKPTKKEQARQNENEVLCYYYTRNMLTDKTTKDKNERKKKMNTKRIKIVANAKRAKNTARTLLPRENENIGERDGETETQTQIIQKHTSNCQRG